MLAPSAAESRFEARQASGPTPLVGREEELALLLRRWAQAREGEGQVVLLAGEPGIGKSRLVRALRERLADEPHTPLRYQCSPHHTNSALHPVIDQLERAAGFRRDDPGETRLAKLEALLAEGTRDVAAVAPLVADLLAVPTGGRYPPLDLTPQRRKERLFEALLARLEGLAGKRPVLEVVEDAHWLDPTTEELLGLAIERARTLPVLLVITARPEFTARWAHHAHVTRLTLNRLSRGQGAALVERVTGGKALPPELLGQIVAKTDGVPLFVEELTKAVLESGLLTDAGDRYELAAGPLPPLAIPSTLHDSLMARLDQLAAVKRVAQVGAAIGREFPHELLAAVAPCAGDRLREALDQLVEAGLIFRRGVPPAAGYSFKHALVQDAAYQSLLKGQRRRLHASIARALEERFPETRDSAPEVLAHHYTQAGLAERAAVYRLRAGERAARNSANLEAIGHLTRGLEVLRALPDAPGRARLELPLLVALGGPLIATRGYAALEVADAYTRAQGLCERLGETGRLFTVLRGLCSFHLVGARLETSRRLSEELLELADRAREPALWIEAHHAAGCTLYRLGDADAARRHFERSIALDAERPHRDHIRHYGSDVGVFCRAYLAHCRWHLGQPDRARATMDEARALAERLSHPFSLALALNYAAVLHQFRREHRGARTQAEAAIALCAEQGFAHVLGAAMISQGWALAEGGDRTAGLARMREGLAAKRATGAEINVPYYLGLIAGAESKAGRAAEGLRVLAEALARAEGTGDRWFEAELHRLEGELLLEPAVADRTRAEACFRRALMVAREQRAKPWELRAANSLARLWRDQGRGTEGRDLLAPVYGWFSEGLDTPDLQDAAALLDELG